MALPQTQPPDVASLACCSESEPHPSGPPFGEVISQTPVAGTSALTGSAVDLEVSIATLPSGDLIRPAVQITLAAGSVGLNEPLTITVSATDGGGIAATTVLINGMPVTLDGNGMATFSSPTPGVFTVEATVLDTAGNAGFATAEFRVVTTGDTTLPTVALSLLEDGSEVTLPTAIIGTADDTDLLRYVLELSEAGKNDFTVFASGTTPVVNAVLGQFDPTLLLNGLYDVRLTAEDTSGNVASVTRSYEVDGGVKIGNFSVSFFVGPTYVVPPGAFASDIPPWSLSETQKGLQNAFYGGLLKTHIDVSWFVAMCRCSRKCKTASGALDCFEPLPLPPPNRNQFIKAKNKAKKGDFVPVEVLAAGANLMNYE